MGDVVNKDVFDGSRQVKIVEGEMVAVISIEMYASCRK